MLGAGDRDRWTLARRHQRRAPASNASFGRSVQKRY